MAGSLVRRPLAALAALLVLLATISPPDTLEAMEAGAAENVVSNGDFEQDADHDGVPDDWQTAGRREVQQTLSFATGRDGGRAAKLECRAFVGGTPDSHVMICQVNQVSIQRGLWYRIAFWCKGEGTIDATTAFHGRQSLRMEIDKDHSPVFCWDYFDALVQPIRTVLAAHRGWIPVEPNKQYVFSCYAKANLPDVPVQLMVYQHEARAATHVEQVGTDWQRLTLAFRPTRSFVWVGAGPDLHADNRQSATVWVDAFQLDAGDANSPGSSGCATGRPNGIRWSHNRNSGTSPRSIRRSIVW